MLYQEKKSYRNYFCTLDGSPEARGWPLPICTPMIMVKKPSLLSNLSYSTWGKDNSLHSTLSQASVSFSNSHGKPGKISIALSKHGMTKGLLDNHSSSWWFIEPMAPLGATLLEKSSLVKLSSFSPPRESASEPAGKREHYYPPCTSGMTLLNLSGMLRENEGDWVPAPWGNSESPFLLAKSEQRHWKGDAGHCGNPALTLQGIWNLWPGRRCGY